MYIYKDFCIPAREKSKFNYTTSRELRRSIRTCHICIGVVCTAFLGIIIFWNCCNITWKNKLLVGNVAWACKSYNFLVHSEQVGKSFDAFDKCRGGPRNIYSNFGHVAPATDYSRNLYRVTHYPLPLSREKSDTMWHGVPRIIERKGEKAGYIIKVITGSCYIVIEIWIIHGCNRNFHGG